MSLGMISKACACSLVVCSCLFVQAQCRAADRAVDRSLLVPERVASLPDELGSRHQQSPLGTLTADASQAELQTVDGGAEGCSDDCCCLVPTSKMCPCTYGWADALILWRDNDATNRPLVINLNSGQSLISTGDLGFDAGWGVRAGFGVRGCGCCGWEFDYLGIFDQNAGRSVELADELALPGDLGL